MNMPLKLTRIGNSTGVVLPKEILAKLGAAAGDYVSVADTDNGIEITPHRDDFEAQMTIARDVMERRKRALRELAK
jgi:putative addiction module antidote